MGGGKRPSLAQIERAQKKEEEKKPKKKPDERRQKVIVPSSTVNPSELMEKIKSFGAITPQSIISVSPMTPGDAKRLLRQMEKGGSLKLVSSFNGQPVYSLKTPDSEPSRVANPAQ